ncbi:MAG: hypothetical protein J6S67_04700 [Methanobrevibacter sp.]|nr:hypothetical protein [Methanobrevibacter sp.]
MYRCGFVPNEYVVEAVYQSNMKRHDSAKRNYQRMVFEAIEDNKELQFGDMLDTEMEKLREVI